MENKGAEAGDVLRFQFKRIITNLFKNYLVILEDLGMEHDIAMQKLYDNLPDQYKPYVVMSDYFTEDKYEILRTKVLSCGNDTIRELDKQLESFDVKIKSPKA